jgi:hypothetical membrane protein
MILFSAMLLFLLCGISMAIYGLYDNDILLTTTGIVALVLVLVTSFILLQERHNKEQK